MSSLSTKPSAVHEEVVQVEAVGWHGGEGGGEGGGEVGGAGGGEEGGGGGG